MSYEDQLEFKRKVVDKAYQNFSGMTTLSNSWTQMYCFLDLPSQLVPAALSTIPSPREYNYRTKITPHFDVPRRKRKSNGTGEKDFEVRIGFGEKGRRSVMDIEVSRLCVCSVIIVNDMLPGMPYCHPYSESFPGVHTGRRSRVSRIELLGSFLTVCP